MATTIGQLVEAVAARLREIGLQTYTEPAFAPVAPAAQVLLDTVDYDTAMAGEADDVNLTVELFLTTGPEGLARLYEYLARGGGLSIKALFEADHTLDGLVDDVTVTSAGTPDLAEVGKSAYYSVKLFLKAMVTLA